MQLGEGGVTLNSDRRSSGTRNDALLLSDNNKRKADTTIASYLHILQWGIFIKALHISEL